MFEHSLIALEARKPARRRWISLPLAVFLHVAVLGALLFANTWSVGAVAEPPVNMVFFETAAPPPPPPPPPRGGGQVPRTPAEKPPEPAVPTQAVQPEEAPDRLPEAASPVVAVVGGGLGQGDPRGSTLGVPGGDPDFGVDHGLGTGGLGIPVVGAAPPVQVVDSAPIPVGGPVKPPQFLVKTPPRYTEMARKAGLQGTVVLQAVIDERGEVTDIRILRGLPLGLDQAAVDAVRSWRFQPATLHGRPVKVYFNLTVNFRLQR